MDSVREVCLQIEAICMPKQSECNFENLAWRIEEQWLLKPEAVQIISKLRETVAAMKSFTLAQLQLLQTQQSSDIVSKEQVAALKAGCRWLKTINNPAQMLAGGAFVLCLRMLELKIREGILTPAIINLFSSWNYHSQRLLRLSVILKYWQSQEQYPRSHTHQSLETDPLRLEANAAVTWIEAIEENVEKTPINMLIEEQLFKQEKALACQRIVCRICLAKVGLASMQAHAKLCQKINQLRLFLTETNTAIKTELRKLGELRQTLIDTAHPSITQRRLIKTIEKMMIAERRRSRKLFPRMTLVGGNAAREVNNSELERIVQQHIAEEGPTELFEELSKKNKKRLLIQKSIASLQLKENGCFVWANKENLIPLVSGEKEFCSRKSIRMQPNNQSVLSEDSNTDSECSSGEKIGGSAQHKSIKKVQTEHNLLSRKCIVQSKCEQMPLKWTRKCMSEMCLAHPEEQKRISVDCFQILKLIGRGSFGRIYLVRRKETRDIYALKIVRMPDDCEKNQLASLKNEHEIFRMIAGNHLVQAPFSFSQGKTHFFVLEYLPGGDLGSVLQKEVYLDEPTAQFYLAQIVLAIEHLHKFGIIHRDLKPENLVIDKHGHLKLTDFGLSEIQIRNKLSKVLSSDNQNPNRKWKRRTAMTMQTSQKNARLIGTPDYIAPEIINNLSTNNFTIDWWSLGVIAYELLVGCKPFCGESVEEVVRNIIEFRIDWPEIGEEEDMISLAAQDLISKLLSRDFVNRLGARGAWELKAHPFFKGVDWAEIKSATPPYAPKSANLINHQALAEDPKLREEIEELIGRKNGKPEARLSSRLEDSLLNNPNFKLEQFVRYDILCSETFEVVSKTVHQHMDKVQDWKSVGIAMMNT